MKKILSLVDPEDNLKIEFYRMDYLQIFPGLRTFERNDFTEVKPEPHNTEHIRDCRPGNGRDLFAKNQMEV